MICQKIKEGLPIYKLEKGKREENKRMPPRIALPVLKIAGGGGGNKENCMFSLILWILGLFKVI